MPPAVPKDVPEFAPPPFPDDAQMLFCIGAQKAGTSWLHDYLAQSPEMHFSRNKELHYFDVRAGRANMALRLRVDAMHVLANKLDLNNNRLNAAVVTRLRDAADLLEIYTGKGWGEDRHDPYLNYLLDGRTTQRLVGDITPSYSILDARHFADMGSIGNAKFIFLLRDPVARMWSHVRMTVTAQIGVKVSLAEQQHACAEHVQKLVDQDMLGKIERSNYIRTMAHLEAAIPADRILYAFYEDLFSGKATAQICDFLGLPHLPADTQTRVNEGVPVPIPDDTRALFRHAFDPQYQGMAKRFGPALPDSWAL